MHKSNLRGLLPMREITAGPGLPLGKPSSPQTSSVGPDRRETVDYRQAQTLYNGKAVTALNALHELRHAETKFGESRDSVFR